MEEKKMKYDEMKKDELIAVAEKKGLILDKKATKQVIVEALTALDKAAEVTKAETEAVYACRVIDGVAIDFSASKQAARIDAIAENARLDSNGGNKSLKKDDFKSSDDWRAFRFAADNYLKMLHGAEAITPILDECLEKVMICLSADAAQIDKVRRANIHGVLIKQSMRYVKRKTPEAREIIKAFNEKINALEEGTYVELDSNDKPLQLSESAYADLLESVKQEKAAYEARQDIWEPSQIVQINFARFIKILQLVIGKALINDTAYIQSYVSLEKRQKNNFWRNKEKQAKKHNLPMAVYEKLFAVNDKDGIKAALEIAKKAQAEGVILESEEDYNEFKGGEKND